MSRNIFYNSKELYVFFVILVLVFYQVETFNSPSYIGRLIADVYVHLSFSNIIIDNAHISVSDPNSRLLFPGSYILMASFNRILCGEMLFTSLILSAACFINFFLILYLVFKYFLKDCTLSCFSAGFAIITNLATVYYPSSQVFAVLYTFLLVMSIYLEKNIITFILFLSIMIADPVYSILVLGMLFIFAILNKQVFFMVPKISKNLIIFCLSAQIFYLTYIAISTLTYICRIILPNIFNNLPESIHIMFIKKIEVITSVGASTSTPMYHNSLSRVHNPLLGASYTIGKIIYIPIYYMVGSLTIIYVIIQILYIYYNKICKKENSPLILIPAIILPSFALLFLPSYGGLKIQGRFVEISYPILVINAMCLIKKFFLRMYKINRAKMILKIVLSIVLIILLWCPYFSLRVNYQYRIGVGLNDLSAAIFVNKFKQDVLIFSPNTSFISVYSYISHVDYVVLIKAYKNNKINLIPYDKIMLKYIYGNNLKHINVIYNNHIS